MCVFTQLYSAVVRFIQTSNISQRTQTCLLSAQLFKVTYTQTHTHTHTLSI